MTHSSQIAAAEVPCSAVLGGKTYAFRAPCHLEPPPRRLRWRQGHKPTDRQQSPTSGGDNGWEARLLHMELACSAILPSQHIAMAMACAAFWCRSEVSFWDRRHRKALRRMPRRKHTRAILMANQNASLRNLLPTIKLLLQSVSAEHDEPTQIWLAVQLGVVREA